MKLKDKKIELLQQVTTRDNEEFAQTPLQPVSAPAWAYFRQRGFRGGNNQLQGRSIIHDKIPHGHNDRTHCAV